MSKYISKFSLICVFLFTVMMNNALSGIYCTKNDAQLTWFTQDLIHWFVANGYDLDRFPPETFIDLLYKVTNNGANEFCQLQKCGKVNCQKAVYCSLGDGFKVENMIDKFNKLNMSVENEESEYKYEKICCTDQLDYPNSKYDKCMNDQKVDVSIHGKNGFMRKKILADSDLKGKTHELLRKFDGIKDKIAKTQDTFYCSKKSKKRSCLEKNRDFYPTIKESFLDKVYQGVCTTYHAGTRLCRFFNPANLNLLDKMNAIHSVATSNTNGLGLNLVPIIASTVFQTTRGGAQLLDEAFQLDKEKQPARMNEFSKLLGFSRAIENGTLMKSIMIARYLDRFKEDLNDSSTILDDHLIDSTLKEIDEIETVIIDEIQSVQTNLDLRTQEKRKTGDKVSLSEVLERNDGISLDLSQSKWTKLKDKLTQIMKVDAMPKSPFVISPFVYTTKECRDFFRYQSPSEEKLFKEQMNELIQLSQYKRGEEILKSLLYIYGEPGTGKTTQIEKLAACLNLPVQKIELSELNDEVFSTLMATGSDKDAGKKLKQVIIKKLKKMIVDGKLVDNGIILFDDLDQIISQNKEKIEGISIDTTNVENTNKSDMLLPPQVKNPKMILIEMRNILLEVIKELSSKEKQSLYDSQTELPFSIKRTKFFITGNSSFKYLTGDDLSSTGSSNHQDNNRKNALYSRITDHEFLPPDLEKRKLLVSDKILTYSPKEQEILNTPSCQKIIQHFLDYDAKNYEDRLGRLGIRGLIDSQMKVFFDRFNVEILQKNKKNCEGLVFDPEQVGNSIYSIPPSLNLVREKILNEFQRYTNNRDNAEILETNPTFQTVFNTFKSRIVNSNTIDDLMNIMPLFLQTKKNLFDYFPIGSKDEIKEKIKEGLNFLKTKDEMKNLIMLGNIFNQIFIKSSHHKKLNPNEWTHYLIKGSELSSFNPLVFDMLAKILNVPLCNITDLAVLSKIIRESPMVKEKYMISKENAQKYSTFFEKDNYLEYRHHLGGYKSECYILTYDEKRQLIMGKLKYSTQDGSGLVLLDPIASNEKKLVFQGFLSLEDIDKRINIYDAIFNYCYNKDPVFKNHPNKALGIILVGNDKRFSITKSGILQKIESAHNQLFQTQDNNFFNLNRNTVLFVDYKDFSRDEKDKVGMLPANFKKERIYSLSTNAKKIYAQKYIKDQLDKIIQTYDYSNKGFDYSKSEKSLFDFILQTDEELAQNKKELSFNDFISLIYEHVVLPCEQRLQNLVGLNLDDQENILIEVNESSLQEKLEKAKKKNEKSSDEVEEDMT